MKRVEITDLPPGAVAVESYGSRLDIVMQNGDVLRQENGNVKTVVEVLAIMAEQTRNGVKFCWAKFTAACGGVWRWIKAKSSASYRGCKNLFSKPVSSAANDSASASDPLLQLLEDMAEKLHRLGLQQAEMARQLAALTT
jgi:hypothetical protein